MTPTTMRNSPTPRIRPARPLMTVFCCSLNSYCDALDMDVSPPGEPGDSRTGCTLKRFDGRLTPGMGNGVPVVRWHTSTSRSDQLDVAVEDVFEHLLSSGDISLRVALVEHVFLQL